MTAAQVDELERVVVRLRDLSKRFGHTKALDGLNLEARGGEILGIAGPNGAGKSTMVGVLAGEVRLDSGDIDIEATWLPTVERRVAVVHQEPQLFDNLTVAENLAVGRERFVIGNVELDDEERDLVRSFDLAAVAEDPLGSLPLPQRQRVEILRGLLGHAHVVLFDEPNSALAPDESRQLFGEMHRLASSGRVVILVSHRLHELAAHCDRVAVIRDGRVRAELVGDDITPERIAEELVAGTVLAQRKPVDHPLADAAVALRVTSWTHPQRRFSDVDLTVRAGEVLAVTGMEGAGGRELVRSLAHLEPARGDYAAAGPVEYVSGDRAGSLFYNLSVEENLTLRNARQFRGPLGWLRRRASRAAAQTAARQFDVKVSSIADPVGELSGGNQQKVAIAAALSTTPAVVVLEEPTRGVDIGAKAEIYVHLRRFAEEGGAVVLYCTEESEVFECADRVVSVTAGAVVAERAVTDFSSVETLAGYLAASAILGGSFSPSDVPTE